MDINDLTTGTSPNSPIPPEAVQERLNTWLLGADPEFSVLTPPDVVIANAGANAVQTTKAAGQIGHDHGGRVWELRPAPCLTAWQVVGNLIKLLQQQELAKLEKFKWKSGALGARKHAAQPPFNLGHWVDYYMGQGYAHLQAQQLAQQNLMQHQQMEAALGNNALDTLGGHVHFGLAGLNPAQRTALNAVTTGLLNLDVLPQKENSRRLEITQNQNLKYGHFDGGDAIRDCNGHVEYRCPPSWLDRPGQALVALAAYKLAAAKPSTVKWPESFKLKADFLAWLDKLAQVDVDAWVSAEYIDDYGFTAVQADPSSDFKLRWRRDNPWSAR